MGDLLRLLPLRSRNGSWDVTRDRYSRGWEVIEIPSCGDLHQRSSPTLLFRCNVGEDNLNLVCNLSWMILGSWFVGTKFFVFYYVPQQVQCTSNMQNITWCCHVAPGSSIPVGSTNRDRWVFGPGWCYQPGSMTLFMQSFRLPALFKFIFFFN